ncbi:hypothetical protein EVC62_06105 [Salinicola endophyticus]|uniref:Uncharacterized protein n=1 Tax=Salinicola endophyticus TaxID=1949083 RepID=A0ABY8FHL0_9GAMM|nr:hypothetical protein [Salinicola endophyticus]WFF41108.1 hypothetical protein EVC62_06105 [Salinicola endophyticus]
MPESIFETPEKLLNMLTATQRVVLVASNPNIRRRHVKSAGITPDSVVFSFNKCRQLHKLPFDTHHCLIHRYGYKTENGVREEEVPGYPHKLRVRLFELFAKSSAAFVLGGEGDVGGEGVSRIPMINSLNLLKEYPFEALPERGGVSSGFYMIALLEELKRNLGLDFTIVLLGFTEGGGGRQWYGHAWDFERRMTAQLEGLEKIDVTSKKS